MFEPTSNKWWFLHLAWCGFEPISNKGGFFIWHGACLSQYQTKGGSLFGMVHV